MHTFSHAIALAISVFIMTQCFFASSQACVCVLHVWSEKKPRPLPSEKTPGRGHKSPRLPVGRHGKQRPQRQAGLQLRGETQTSIAESMENVLWVLLDA